MALYNQIQILYTPQESGLHYIGTKVGSAVSYVVQTQNIAAGQVGVEQTYTLLISANTYCDDVDVDYFVVPECGYNPEIIPPTHPSAVTGTVTFVEQATDCLHYNLRNVAEGNETISLPPLGCNGDQPETPQNITFAPGEEARTCIDAELAEKLNGNPEWEVSGGTEKCQCTCYETYNLYCLSGNEQFVYQEYTENFFSPGVSEADNIKYKSVSVGTFPTVVQRTIVPGTLKSVTVPVNNTFVMQLVEKCDCTAPTVTFGSLTQVPAGPNYTWDLTSVTLCASCAPGTTYEYYTDNTLTSLIATPAAYVNTGSEFIYVKIDDGSGCPTVTHIELDVSNPAA